MNDTKALTHIVSIRAMLRRVTSVIKDAPLGTTMDALEELDQLERTVNSMKQELTEARKERDGLYDKIDKANGLPVMPAAIQEAADIISEVADYINDACNYGTGILGSKSVDPLMEAHALLVRDAAPVPQSGGSACTRESPDTVYLIGRLERVVELLKAGETHMAIAKLLADIAALKTLQKPTSKPSDSAINEATEQVNKP